ncbi:hypothetical protein [Natronorubrum sp. FCH18a]|uniref:hypothetical protein n=1 Tax=Natronorubrum sp. FCH18a TaxID=3447018 RepID=UPI003F519CF5
MQLDSNTNRNRLGYEYPYADTLDDRKEELYWSATQRAEDSLSRIWKVQDDRIDENGDINWRLTMDHFCELKEAITELEEAITYLDLIARAEDWTVRNQMFREAFCELIEAGVETDEALDVLNPGYDIEEVLDE